MSGPIDDRPVTIGLAVAEGVTIETTVCLIRGLAQFSRPIHLSVHKGCYVHENRNGVVRDALEVGSTHIIFVDTDVTFPPDGLERLLAHRDKPIVGANYNTKSDESQRSTVKMLGADGKLANVPAAEIPAVPFRCAAVATGFMAIRIGAVIGRVADPWFYTDYDERGLVGEDVKFCERARAAGIEVWCDPTIQVGHVGPKLY